MTLIYRTNIELYELLVFKIKIQIKKRKMFRSHNYLDYIFVLLLYSMYK